MNLVLIGMPACGKSTAGVVLAKTAGMAFLDTDLLIQEREGDLLQNIIDAHGIQYFLQREEKALLSVETKRSVIATGGSAVYSRAGMEHLRSIGKVVYLRLSLSAVSSRLDNIKTRGIAMGKGESLESLYARRTPLYESYAHEILDVEDLSLEETVEALILLLPCAGAPPRF